MKWFINHDMFDDDPQTRQAFPVNSPRLFDFMPSLIKFVTFFRANTCNGFWANARSSIVAGVNPVLVLKECLLEVRAVSFWVGRKRLKSLLQFKES